MELFARRYTMSELYLLVSSESRAGTETTDDFTVGFTPSINIPGNWSLALESLTLWYSYYNISVAANNQTFRYYNGAIWKDVIVTPGLYTIEALNSFIQTAMANNGDYTVGPPVSYFISILPNYNTFKTRVTISGGYQVDFTVGNLRLLLGFDSKIVTATEESAGNVNITGGIERLQILCDIISGSYSGGSLSTVLYSFSVDVPPSSQIQISPNRLIFLPLTTTGYLNRIRIRIVDQLGRRVDLNGEPVTASLILRRV
jgi:hypothetical protein